MTPHQQDEYVAFLIWCKINGARPPADFKQLIRRLPEDITLGYETVLPNSMRCRFCGKDLGTYLVGGLNAPPDGGDSFVRKTAKVVWHTEPCKRALIEAHPLEHLAALDM